MLHIDYDWDLGSTYIIPDKEIDFNKLEWQAGDYWQMIEVDGNLQLRKVDPITKFLLQGNDCGFG